MPFLSRRSVDPLTSASQIKDTGCPTRKQSQTLPQNSRIRSRSESSLFRRVSTFFAARRRSSSKGSPSQTNASSAAIGYIHSYPWDTLSRLSSDTTSDSSLEIRRPSGLGRRASLLKSSDSFTDTDSLQTLNREVDATPAVFTSLPNLLRDVPCTPHGSRPHRDPYYAASFTLPDPIFRAVLEFIPKCHLPAVARVCRRFCSAARYALYRALDIQNMREPSRAMLYDVLASRKELAALVVSFCCHTWPSCERASPDGRPSSIISDVRRAFQNMYNLKSLTLPSFVSILSHTPSFTFSLTHLAILDQEMTQSQLVALRSWLATQPSLESLSFPHLAEYTNSTGPSFVDECIPASDSNEHSTPFSSILPSLKSLRASAEIVSALCFAVSSPIQHLTLDVHDTLYTGLRPGAIIRSLRGVRDMHIIFAPEVDKRTVEKFLCVTGSMLAGENKPEAMKSLEVEVSWADNDGAETLYGIVTSIISRFRGLETLKLTSPFRSIHAPIAAPSSVPFPSALSSPQTEAQCTPASTPASALTSIPATHRHHHHGDGGGNTIRKEFVTCGVEQSYARTWTKRCPSLSDIQFDFTCATMDDADVELCGVWFRRKVPTTVLVLS